MAKVSTPTAYAHRSDDPEFKARWDDAVEQAIQVLEQEAHRRAAIGVRRPVFQSGKLVGTVTEYSDTLLIFLLKANRPHKYRDNHRVEISTPAGESVKVDHGGTVSVDHTLPFFDRLEQLTDVFVRAAEREGGNAPDTPRSIGSAEASDVQDDDPGEPLDP